MTWDEKAVAVAELEQLGDEDGPFGAPSPRDADLAEKYLEHWRALGDAELHDAWEAVNDEVSGPDPLPLIDALLRLAVRERAPEFLCYVAAGPLEDALKRRDLWNPLAVTCRRSRVWTYAVRGSWVNTAVADTLPSPLDGLVTRLGAPAAPPGRRKRGRRGTGR